MICKVEIEFQEYEKKFDKNLKPSIGVSQAIDSGSFITSYFAYSRGKGFSLAKKRKKDSIMKIMKYDILGRIESVCYAYDDTYLNTTQFFDTLGNVTKVIDERKADKYPICFREALEIVKKKTPKKYTIIGLERDSMTVNNKKIYHWLVATGDPKKYYWYYYYINAKTGKIIKKVRVQQGYD